MITKQFLNLTMNRIFGDGAFTKAIQTNGKEAQIKHTTYDSTFVADCVNLRTTLTGNTATGPGVVFLNGGSDPSADDYTSDGTVVTGLSIATTVTNNNGDDSVGVTCVYIITNNNDFDVTIDEVCWIASKRNTANSTNYFLADRTKLENPITIAASGGMGKITYTVATNLL
jgi:hypothetical protein